MNVFVTGVCGFVGSALALELLERREGLTIHGIDNFVRPGSEGNRERLARAGVKIRHGDVRMPSDLENLPPIDWVIDAAANPSVLAGVDGKTSSLQLVEHNLTGTIHLMELCRRHKAGFTLLSTSRVYSIPPLASMAVEIRRGGFVPAADAVLPIGLSTEGVAEAFSTAPPVSLYGSTKLASEVLAMEYGCTFDFPVWINRCGVLAGAGQFGRPDQGIFSYWINSHLRKRPLKYIGFEGTGAQVRDVFHPRDLARMVLMQWETTDRGIPRLMNLSGGALSAMSLRQLTAWCDGRFGAHPVSVEPAPRPFDIPWMVLDSRLASAHFDWHPEVLLADILEEIAVHAEANPGWLELSAPL